MIPFDFAFCSQENTDLKPITSFKRHYFRSKRKRKRCHLKRSPKHWCTTSRSKLQKRKWEMPKEGFGLSYWAQPVFHQSNTHECISSNITISPEHQQRTYTQLFQYSCRLLMECNDCPRFSLWTNEYTCECRCTEDGVSCIRTFKVLRVTHVLRNAGCLLIAYRTSRHGYSLMCAHLICKVATAYPPTNFKYNLKQSRCLFRAKAITPHSLMICL